MSEPHATPHGTPVAPFTHEEILAFQASDRGAAKVIVLLMTAIFTTGLILYTAIALSV
jgi:hypothetical protein